MNWANMNKDNKPGVLRSTGKNNQKRNTTGFLNDPINQAANNTLRTIAA